MAITVSVVLALLLTTVQASAAPGPSRLPRCVGTYLVVGESGDTSTWTLSADGTVQKTSSSEDAAFFTHQQGAWRQLPSGEVHVTTLDFPVDGVVTPVQVARVDAALTFSNACADLAGSLDLRFYSVPSEDPLDPTDGSFILSEDFTGRQVTAY
jgi:hypothetical protein